MILKNLVQQRHNINCDIIECLQDDIRNIKILAETMVECATNIKGQGYSTFISAREDFLSSIDSLYQQIEDSAGINNCTHH